MWKKHPIKIMLFAGVASIIALSVVQGIYSPPLPAEAPATAPAAPQTASAPAVTPVAVTMPKPETDPTKMTSAQLDKSNLPMQGCSEETIRVVMAGIPTVSWMDGVSICHVMHRQIGDDMSISTFRAMLKTVTMLQVAQGKESDPTEKAEEVMRVIKARGITDQAKMWSTMDLLVKIANGTTNDVTPNDIYAFLRSAGPMAHTLSDEGLVHMAALIKEEQKTAD